MLEQIKNSVCQVWPKVSRERESDWLGCCLVKEVPVWISTLNF